MRILKGIKQNLSKDMLVNDFENICEKKKDLFKLSTKYFLMKFFDEYFNKK